MQASLREHAMKIINFKKKKDEFINKYSVPKKVPIAFYNGSNYGSHFIIKELG